VRPSNTEPIARIIAEGRTEEEAKQLAAEVLSMLGIARAPAARLKKPAKKSPARKLAKARR
jgi:hypothetical protein